LITIPENDKNKGFQVQFTSRFSNSAGGTKEIYYSNGGELNLDTNKISPRGGLTEREAAEMGLKANLLPELSLSEVTKIETNANTGYDILTSNHIQKLDGMCSFTQNTKRSNRSRLSTLNRLYHGQCSLSYWRKSNV
jgi:hypothetical protein